MVQCSVSTGKGQAKCFILEGMPIFSAECFSLYSKGPAHINMVYLPSISQGLMIISWFKIFCNTLKNS